MFYANVKTEGELISGSTGRQLHLFDKNENCIFLTLSFTEFVYSLRGVYCCITEITMTVIGRLIFLLPILLFSPEWTMKFKEVCGAKENAFNTFNSGETLA